MSKIRVLQIIAGLAIGEPLGGAELFGAELVRHFDPATCEPVVCAFWRHGGRAERHWEKRLRDVGVEVCYAADFHGKFKFSAFLGGVQRVGKMFEPGVIDVIHSHFQVGTLAALILRRRLRVPVVMRTAHITLEWGPGLVEFACRQLFTKWLFPLTLQAQAGVSRAVVDQLDHRPGMYVARKQGVFIPNGVALDRFQSVLPFTPKEVRGLGLSPEKLTVGCVGRLTEQKGYTYLLEAIPEILARRSDVQFVFVGDGDLREALREQAERLGIASAVHFLGPRQDVERFFRLMDLFVLPSLWEGLPTVVMEAMASKVPVIATDVRGTRELVFDGETGWLVAPKEPKELTQTILHALEHPEERHAIVHRASQYVLRRYSMKTIASDYETLYHRLLSQFQREK